MIWARAWRAAALIYGLVLPVAAWAEDAVLVEKAGTIRVLPGGSDIREGQHVDSSSRIHIRSGEYAIFLFKNGNLVRLNCDGCPACDIHPAAQGPSQAGGAWFGRLLVAFDRRSQAPVVDGCAQ